MGLTALERTRRNLARVMPFDTWCRRAPRSESEKEMYWKVVQGFKDLIVELEAKDAAKKQKAKKKARKKPAPR